MENNKITKEDINNEQLAFIYATSKFIPPLPLLDLSELKSKVEMEYTNAGKWVWKVDITPSVVNGIIVDKKTEKDGK